MDPPPGTCLCHCCRRLVLESKSPGRLTLPGQSLHHRGGRDPMDPPPGTCLCHCYRRLGLESKSPGLFILPGQAILLLPQGWEGPMDTPPGTCLWHCCRRLVLESKSPGRLTLPGQSLHRRGGRDPMDAPPLGPVCATATAGLGSKVNRPGDLLCRGNPSCHCYRRGGRDPWTPPPGTCLWHCYRRLGLESKLPGRFTLPGRSFLPLQPQGWEGPH